MCDRVTVLRDGVTVGQRQRHEVSERQLVELITGHPAVLDVMAESVAEDSTSEPLFEADGVRAEGLPGPITFTLKRGEILGITGSLEAGHHALGELAFGLRQPAEGRFRLAGSEYAPTTPQAALALGIRFVPADRNLFGIAARLTLQENLFMTPPRVGDAAASWAIAERPSTRSTPYGDSTSGLRTRKPRRPHSVEGTHKSSSSPVPSWASRSSSCSPSLPRASTSGRV